MDPQKGFCTLTMYPKVFFLDSGLPVPTNFGYTYMTIDYRNLQNPNMTSPGSRWFGSLPYFRMFLAMKEIVVHFNSLETDILLMDKILQHLFYINIYIYTYIFKYVYIYIFNRIFIYYVFAVPLSQLLLFAEYTPSTVGRRSVKRVLKKR